MQKQLDKQNRFRDMNMGQSLGKSLIVFLLQILGLVGISFIGKYGLALGIAYGLLLVIIASIRTRGSKNLSNSPLYLHTLITAFYGVFVAFVVFPFPDAVEGAFSRVYDIPTNLGTVMFPLFGTLTLGIVWLNIWTEKHSKAVYLLCVMAAISFAMFLLFLSAVANFGI